MNSIITKQNLTEEIRERGGRDAREKGEGIMQGKKKEEEKRKGRERKEERVRANINPILHTWIRAFMET
jgi:hypothetical protein